MMLLCLPILNAYAYRQGAYRYIYIPWSVTTASELPTGVYLLSA